MRMVVLEESKAQRELFGCPVVIHMRILIKDRGNRNEKERLEMKYIECIEKVGLVNGCA